jgi:CRP-like cAMP-binding protein
VFQIVSGTVMLYRLTADGRRLVQDFATDGDFLALTFGEEHDLSAEALTEVTATFVSRTMFDQMLQDNVGFRRSVFAMVGSMLHAVRQQTLLLGLKSAMERTASFLIFLESRFESDDKGYTAIRMSRSDIADYLGLTLETVSRMLNRLKQLGVIELPRCDTFRVRDPERLLALAGESSGESGRLSATG